MTGLARSAFEKVIYVSSQVTISAAGASQHKRRWQVFSVADRIKKPPPGWNKALSNSLYSWTSSDAIGRPGTTVGNVGYSSSRTGIDGLQSASEYLALIVAG